MLFYESDEVCETSYADRGGKYQGQRGRAHSWISCGWRSFECSRALRQLPLTPSPCLRRGRGQGEGSRLKPLTPEATDFAITSGTFAIANFALVSDPNHRSAAMGEPDRSEEHTSELQSLMRISYAVFCLKK